MYQFDLKDQQLKKSLEQFQKEITLAPSLLQTAFKRSIRRSKARVLRRLRRVPGRPSYPLRWAPSRHAEDAGKTPNTRWGYYSRQKAAFFATDGFGKGIPTRRTGAITDAWDGEYIREGASEGLYRIFNSNPDHVYVQGELQQPFHKDTGWDYAPDVIDDAQVELISILDETYITVMNETAGV